MLGIRASPKEESGTSAGEEALGHVLAVPGQLLSTTAPPADTPAPPEVIPVAKRIYSMLRPLLPLPWMELPTPTCSAAVWGQGVQAAGGQVGGGHHQGPAEAPRGAGTAGGGGAAAQGAPSPERRVEDLRGVVLWLSNPCKVYSIIYPSNIVIKMRESCFTS